MSKMPHEFQVTMPGNCYGWLHQLGWVESHHPSDDRYVLDDLKEDDTPDEAKVTRAQWTPRCYRKL